MTNMKTYTQGLSVLSPLGRLHQLWLRYPFGAAALGFGFALFLWGFAWALGIDVEVKTQDGKKLAGFMKTHWGPQSFLAMPLAPLVFAFLLIYLDRGISSLDKIIHPIGAQESFSSWVKTKLGRNWRYWIFPASLLVPLVLTLALDYPGILAPLIYDSAGDIPEHAQRGWGTDGAFAHPETPRWLFLVFNASVFSTQVFYGYCAFGLAFLFTFLIRTAMKCGLKDTYEDQNQLFLVRWNFRDPSGRCGLLGMDRVFAIYVGAILLSLGVCIWSVRGHLSETGRLDGGSLVLAVGNLILFPAAFFWFILPYWTAFPRSLPSNLKEEGYYAPSAWPFGSEKLTWVLIGGAVYAWGYLLWLGGKELLQIAGMPDP